MSISSTRDPRDPTQPSTAPPLPSLASEGRVLLEPLRWLRWSPALARAPRGQGTVIVLPGYRTTDRATALLRAWLRHLGHDARGWGLGVNAGGVEGVLPRLQERTRDLEAPFALIGWSWGGVIARAWARAAPHRIQQVVTLGTPIQGGARHTRFARWMSDAELDRSARRAAALERAPLPVPALSIYTPHDAVVAWTASRDPRPDQTRHLAVGSCHLGLVASPAVWIAIAEQLADPPPARSAGVGEQQS